MRTTSYMTSFQSLDKYSLFYAWLQSKVSLDTVCEMSHNHNFLQVLFWKTFFCGFLQREVAIKQKEELSVQLNNLRDQLGKSRMSGHSTKADVRNDMYT